METISDGVEKAIYFFAFVNGFAIPQTGVENTGVPFDGVWFSVRSDRRSDTKTVLMTGNISKLKNFAQE